MQGIIYQNIKKSYGLTMAKDYFSLHQKAILEYENLVNKYDIKCEFTKLPAYLFTRKNSKLLLKEYDTLKQIGADVSFFNKLENISIHTNGVIKIENQAMFHPLKFLMGLPKNFTIYENSRVIHINLKENRVTTKNGSALAKYLVLATHFPIFTCPKLFPFKMYQSKSYALGYKNSTNLNGLYIEDKSDGLTLRNYKSHIIVGGGDHNTNVIKKYSSYEKLSKEVNTILKQNTISYSWQTQDCMTIDQIPYIGKLNDEYPNVFIATGFNKWGMAKALMGAKLISDLIEGKTNSYEILCSTSRKALLKNKKNALTHSANSVFNLLKSFFKVPLKSYKKLNNCEGGIFLVKGKKCGVYKDEKGEFHFVEARCSHLKCELKFDIFTKTFICPCHGSWYDIDGNILCEPAIKPIGITKKINS